MATNNTAPNNQEQAQSTQITPPSLSLPKGGGAIRGIGEKFAANPVTGTASMTVPLAISPGRSNFSPQLALSYDSGTGNGPFGFGWHLALPTITRKTDKGLPQYLDTNESDVYLLSGAEDLVPILTQVGTQWQRATTTHTLNGTTYRIQGYQPRIEGLFSRIERWTDQQTGDIHWRSISKENVTTLYGQDNTSRIFDPTDATPPQRIFSWLISASYDDKGNAIIYEYKAENSDGIDLSLASEQNRTPTSRSANRYLKRIKYGNLPSRLTQPDLTQATWLFELVFDYGEHDNTIPLPNEAHPWLSRHDPFSSYRSCFEVRTYRLCQRVLMFHHFPNETNVGPNCLVRSTDIVYQNTLNNPLAHSEIGRRDRGFPRQSDPFPDEKPLSAPTNHALTGSPEDLSLRPLRDPLASFISSITHSSYTRQADGSYLKKSLPPLEFTYTQAALQSEVHELDTTSLENLPAGLDHQNYQWVDLDSEGVSGILTEQSNTWFYKPNLGNAQFGPLANRDAQTLARHTTRQPAITRSRRSRASRCRKPCRASPRLLQAHQ